MNENTMNKKFYLDIKIENSIANICLKRSPINAFSINFLNEILDRKSVV